MKRRPQILVFVLMIIFHLCSGAPAGNDYDEDMWVWGTDDKNDDTSPPVPPTIPTQATTKAPTGTTRACPECPITPEYNPVCGTDKITYNNPSALRCTQSCGADIQLQFYGLCEPLLTSPNGRK